MNKDRVKVSVIIPLYNEEKRIVTCVYSILSQTLREIEVIIIDDGSTDNSLQVALSLKEKDPRIIVFHQENQGQGAARNSGIQISSGEYITFADSDDEYDNNDIIRLMYESSVAERADLTVAGAIIRELDHSETRLAFPKRISLSGCKENIVYFSDARFMVSTCNKMYRAKMIKEHQISFYKYGVVASEDTLFNNMVYPCCQSIVVLPQCGYVQNKHSNSTSTTGVEEYENRIISQFCIMGEESPVKNEVYYGLMQNYAVHALDSILYYREYHGQGNNIKQIDLILKKIQGSPITSYIMATKWDDEVYITNKRYYKTIWFLMRHRFWSVTRMVLAIKQYFKVKAKIYGKQFKK